MPLVPIDLAKNRHLAPDHTPDLDRFHEQLGDDWVRLCGALTPDQRTAIGVLLYAPSVAAAARALDVPPSRLYRWLREDDFKGALEHIQRASIEQGGRYLGSCWLLAIDTLADVAATSSDEGARISAARTLADLALKQQKIELDRRKLDGVERRLEKLETDWDALQDATDAEIEEEIQRVARAELAG